MQTEKEGRLGAALGKNSGRTLKSVRPLWARALFSWLFVGCRRSRTVIILLLAVCWLPSVIGRRTGRLTAAAVHITAGHV